MPRRPGMIPPLRKAGRKIRLQSAGMPSQGQKSGAQEAFDCDPVKYSNPAWPAGLCAGYRINTNKSAELTRLQHRFAAARDAEKERRFACLCWFQAAN